MGSNKNYYTIYFCILKNFIVSCSFQGHVLKTKIIPRKLLLHFHYVGLHYIMALVQTLLISEKHDNVC